MLTVKSLGHACYTFSDGAHTLILDPWLTGNPDAVCGPEDVRVDFILPSHGHGDHLGDAVGLSKAQGAPIVAVAELCAYCTRHGAAAISMHIGGRREFPFGSVKLTPAFHGSAVMGDDLIEYTGLACGFLVEIGGRRAYFAGDTGLFGDMALIPGRQGLDVAILPIGDNYTMGVEDALRAVEFLRPKVVIPTHYHAFEAIRTDPSGFAEQVRNMGAECRVLAPGEETEI
ncbi:MAG: metal-dependent hydrolase [Armatimonadetes bacterium]|jgi:L-ascorbate metabolism protein UlaG (beta-lactamase superfamily)|nr:metal-dependent hydrolase [Armatimonadota bacterium]MDI9583024.1 metal-dependent hydrolase [Acidobacteriota bacterium]